MTEAAARSALDERLWRMEDLLSELDRPDGRSSREAARELLRQLVDLHGIALARTIAALARTRDGGDTLARLTHDPEVEAVLLLHGLHPDDAVTRIRRALATLAREGIHASLVALDRHEASISLSAPHGGGLVMQRIERVLYAAAPELDRITIKPLGHARLEVPQLVAV